MDIALGWILMATFQRFEDIEAWQDARRLTNMVYQLSNEGRFARDFALKDQIRRACISITSNIAEGFERGGPAEFRQFLSISKASSGEVRSQLYLAKDQGYITETQFEEIRTLLENINKKLFGLIKYLNRTTVEGTKFKT